jgi:hypothetical protein
MYKDCFISNSLIHCSYSSCPIHILVVCKSPTIFCHFVRHVAAKCAGTLLCCIVCDTKCVFWRCKVLQALTAHMFCNDPWAVSRVIVGSESNISEIFCASAVRIHMVRNRHQYTVYICCSSYVSPSAHASSLWSADVQWETVMFSCQPILYSSWSLVAQPYLRIKSHRRKMGWRLNSMVLDFSGHKKEARKDRLALCVCVYIKLTLCHIVLNIVESV